MIYWYLLNYKIYKFYQNRGEMFPDVYSWVASTLFIQSHIMFAVYNFDQKHKLSKVYGENKVIWSVIIILSSLTYFILYYKKRYIKIFREIDLNRDIYDNKFTVVNWYMVLSIIWFFITLFFF